MKTNNKNQKDSELKSRPEQLSTSTEATNGEKGNQKMQLYVNFKEREANRKLPTKRVLEVLKRWMPRQYRIATVVGDWIWISFFEVPIPQIRQELSQLGFHWNRKRQLWQHPCGKFAENRRNAL